MAKKRQTSKRPTTTGSLDREILATLKEISRKLTDILRALRAKEPRVFDEGGEGGSRDGPRPRPLPPRQHLVVQMMTEEEPPDDSWADEGRAPAPHPTDFERQMTPEQLEDQRVRDMGADLGRVYHALWNEVTWLHMQWRLYRQLYGTSEARVNVLKQAASFLFFAVHRAFVDAVILHIATLLEKPQSSSGRADERKVKQVLLNLLSNALKFTPEGGRIDVRAAVNDGMVEVSVADTGVGIAPEDQEAVFEEFRQVGTADKKVEGTGLGLALSRKFIELHGGRIWVKSQVGQGATFTFTLPVRREPSDRGGAPTLNS